MKHHAEGMYDYWNVPYLPLDPEDIGRKYEADVIRINSQSGKGGVAYILENTYGIRLPKDMREGFGYLIKDISDKRHQELSPEEIKSIFETSYVNRESPIASPTSTSAEAATHGRAASPSPSTAGRNTSKPAAKASSMPSAARCARPTIFMSPT